MPPTRLPERPKPPTGQQMLADIAGADDNDVVFLTGQSIDLSDLTPMTPDGGAEGGDRALTEASLAQAERRELAQRSYHRTLELLEKVELLEESPGHLENRFTHLNDLGAEVSKIIKDLQESSSHLMQKKTASKASKSNKKKR
ncbi:uncharacterized protein LOC143275896 [Babylonia areolata]|uniref:uncharacterized protein LOC143275896 n=1 Tax=Babylonia areolata TaxID=304850 RepID=UPI003FD50D31